ncbi:MAG: hypothetical protein JOZ37_12780 [Actinobacteria bacterium]|nr:hypothetical protein [Actinomycetota bacterium]MBV8958066.1 hypothetical protein [Actinomycetota bacterium]MBV9254449.1 hypothetical protein [Actinomycetota bacterium]MBV9664835.1 hypothetical protein [Actinomycetota bacterium]
MSVFGGVRSFRRTAVTLGLAAAVVIALPSWSPADPSNFSNGTAAASAQAFKVNPTASALSLGVTFGISLAGYTNQVAKADARGIDLGIIGTILAAAGCDGSAPTLASDQQPQPLALDSRDQGAANGKTEPETVMGSPLPFITKSAKASSAPLADAGVQITQLGQPAAFTISGATSSARTEIIKGNIRQAVATADIGSIDIGAGAVKLGGLHWDLTNHSGGDSSTVHNFTIGSAVIGGQAVPSQDAGAVIDAANKVLNPIGIVIKPPTFRQVNGGYTVDPLSIAVVPSTTRDQISGTILGALQPVRQQVTDALLKASCKFGSPLTVADVAVGSITGAGSFSLELGGVSASTGDIQTSSLLDQSLSAVPDTSLSSNALPATPAIAGTPAIAPGAPTIITNRKGAVQGRRLAKPIAASTPGHRGGMLALVGGIGLALLLAAIEGDRRLMRRAERTHSSTEG